MFLAVFIIWPLLEALLTPDAATWRSLSESARWRSATLNTLWLTALSGGSAVVLGLLYARRGWGISTPRARSAARAPRLDLLSPPFAGARAPTRLVSRSGLSTRPRRRTAVRLSAWT